MRKKTFRTAACLLLAAVVLASFAALASGGAGAGAAGPAVRRLPGRPGLRLYRRDPLRRADPLRRGGVRDPAAQRQRRLRGGQRRRPRHGGRHLRRQRQRRRRAPGQPPLPHARPGGSAGLQRGRGAGPRRLQRPIAARRARSSGRAPFHTGICEKGKLHASVQLSPDLDYTIRGPLAQAFLRRRRSRAPMST